MMGHRPVLYRCICFGLALIRSLCFDMHHDDVIMTMLAFQITSLTVVYSIVYSGVNQRKHQSSASLAFVREIHRGPVNFPHKWPVTRKMFDVIMRSNFCLVGYDRAIQDRLVDIHMRFSQTLGMGLPGRLPTVSPRMFLQVKSPTKRTVALLLLASDHICCITTSR